MPALFAAACFPGFDGHIIQPSPADCRTAGPLQAPVEALSGDAPVLVRMELARIIISEINDQQIIYLREVEGERVFPILIGIFEATSIDRRVKGEIPPRPLTHDLLKNAIEEMGGEVQDVVINNLMDHTYYAVVRIRYDGELIEVDSRPSDAIALSVHYDPPLPIYVDESVLDEVA